MRFVDQINCTVSSGRGGRGCVSFAASRRKAKGGPDGGDGGVGGNVIFKVDPRLTSLSHLTKKMYKAGDGCAGRPGRKHGKKGEDLILETPSFTYLVTKDCETSLSEPPYLFLKGGRGGRGNTFFKTSRNRSPKKFGAGKEGVSADIQLEMRLKADIALLGLRPTGPFYLEQQKISSKTNSQSSSLPKNFKHTYFLPLKKSLSSKTMPYQYLFTNKYPCLYTKGELSMIEIPGLLKYSTSFLKHALSSRLLVCVLGATHVGQLIEDMKTLRAIIQDSDPVLAGKKKILYFMDPSMEAESQLPRKKDKEIQALACSFADQSVSHVASLRKAIEKYL